MANTKIGKRTIVDEMCLCGHLKSQHMEKEWAEDMDILEIGLGHGVCEFCECEQFTWQRFIFDDDE